jgi:multicomponent Na+:H+ antiporter subunit B
MTSFILLTTARLLLPLLLMFSVFLLLRGHNEPGGGFVAGLVAAAAWVLYALASDTQQASRALRLDPRALIGWGLLAAVAGGLLGLLFGQPFLAAWWTEVSLPGGATLKLGTPLLFDLGVSLTVLGVTLTIVFALAEE